MKLLSVDIETSPNVADVWGLFNQNVSLNQLRQSTRMICWAAKWHGEKKVMFRSEFHDGTEQMIADAHALLDEADAVIHYNGTSFDVPHLNREFLTAGLNPPSPFQQIDLVRTAKKKFRFPSNKLQYVSTAVGLPGKVQHSGHDLWVRCLAGDAAAWGLMRRYNRQDVVLTEQLYDRLLPWIGSHPNRAMIDGVVGHACPKCGSTDVQRRGVSRTLVSTFQRFQCNACGSWSRAGRRETGADLREAA